MTSTVRSSVVQSETSAWTLWLHGFTTNGINYCKRHEMPLFFIISQLSLGNRQMIHFLSLTTLFSLLSGNLALSPRFLACQLQKPAGSSPLLSCPQGTIFVSQNTSDPYAHFHSVQEAVLSLCVLLISNVIHSIVLRVMH